MEDHQAVRRFVEQSSSRPGDQPPPGPGDKSPGKRSVVRKDGRELRKVGLYLDVRRFKELKTYCVQQDRDLSEIVDEIVARFLEQPGSVRPA